MHRDDEMGAFKNHKAFSSYMGRCRTLARKFSIGGLCDSSGGFAIVRGLHIIKLTKTPLIHSVARLNLGDLELCLGG